MNYETTIHDQARDLMLFATSTQQYYPRLQAIERLVQRRYDRKGTDVAMLFAYRKLYGWLEEPARHYLQQHFVHPDFVFDNEAIRAAARSMADDMVYDCESGYFREV